MSAWFLHNKIFASSPQASSCLAFPCSVTRYAEGHGVLPALLLKVNPQARDFPPYPLFAPHQLFLWSQSYSLEETPHLLICGVFVAQLYRCMQHSASHQCLAGRLSPGCTARCDLLPLERQIGQYSAFSHAFWIPPIHF